MRMPVGEAHRADSPCLPAVDRMVKCCASAGGLARSWTGVSPIAGASNNAQTKAKQILMRRSPGLPLWYLSKYRRSKRPFSSVDADHHVGRFDDGVGFRAGPQAEFFRRLFGDDGNNFDSRRDLDDHFGIDGAGRDGLDRGGKNIACAQSHGMMLLKESLAA